MRAATPSSRTTNTRASSVAPAQGIVEVGSRSRRNPFIAEETTKKKKRHSASVRLSSYSAAILAAVACSSLLLSVSEAAPQFGRIPVDGSEPGRAGFRLPLPSGNPNEEVQIVPGRSLENARAIDDSDDVVIIEAASFPVGTPLDNSGAGRAGFRLPKFFNQGQRDGRQDSGAEKEPIIVVAGRRVDNEDNDDFDASGRIPVDGSLNGRAGFRLPKMSDFGGDGHEVVLVPGQPGIVNPADLQIDDDVVEVGVADFRTPVDGSEDGQAGFRLPKSLGGNGHEVVLVPGQPGIVNPEDLEEEDDAVTVEAAVGRGTPVDGSVPGRAGFRLPKALGGEEHELTLVPGQPSILNPEDLIHEIEDAVVVGGGRGGRGRIPVDASEPGAAGFKLLVAATGEGDEAHVGDEVRLVPGGAEDEEEDDVVLIEAP